eukprot:TRINITY_DN14643_c0_g1_i1.p1 TRINITY_DN14643_c0_g1~~TRINITY_DN14643_c0_g1_i1.p1  ORF type:complete len:516 (-),score=151.14 TRINITY_DN14643_c0_g1_i1:831-2312(-)
MLCAISGQPPEVPVISAKSGHLFERSLIEKYIEVNGKCPITKEELGLDDLIAVQQGTTVKPRPVTATSIPGMLQLFQSEWDALMLESFTLKQHLEQARQELSQTLYQHDAACRVIARLIRERDEARSGLSSMQAQIADLRANGPTDGGDGMEVEAASTINEQLIGKLDSLCKELSAGRRKRQISSTLRTQENIKAYKTSKSVNIHKATPPGVLCVDVHKDQNRILTGGADSNVVVFNRSTGKKVTTLSAHSKRVNQVSFHPTSDILLSASQDKTVRVWSQSSSKTSSYKDTCLAPHKDAVTGISLHPMGEHVASTSLDGTWAFHDINTGTRLASIVSPNSEGLTSTQFHPDALLLATGTSEGTIRVWDIKTQNNVANFEGHQGATTSIAFSENGYYLATAAEDGTIKVWDLRKLKNIKTVSGNKKNPFVSVALDYSGTYLAAAGPNVSVYQTRTLEQIATFGDHTDTVTDVKFGVDASFLVSTSLDRSVKFYE